MEDPRLLSAQVEGTLRNLEQRMKARQTDLKGTLISVPPICPRCNDTMIIEVEEPDRPTFMARIGKPCECVVGRRKRRLAEMWVPEIWRGLRAESLRPASAISRDFPIKQQEEVIAAIKKDPLGAHSFLGPSGTGKSRFLHCLLQEAIEASRKHIFFSKMAPLSERFGIMSSNSCLRTMVRANQHRRH